mgnify:CR=1 FL=1
MYYSKKKETEVPLEMTAVWYCAQDGCNGWMRDNFSFEEAPTCHFCHTPMVSGMRELPVLVNSREIQKSNLKGKQIVSKS